MYGKRSQTLNFQLCPGLSCRPCLCSSSPFHVPVHVHCRALWVHRVTEREELSDGNDDSSAAVAGAVDHECHIGHDAVHVTAPVGDENRASFGSSSCDCCTQ